MSALSRRSCRAGAAVAAAFSTVLAISLVVPVMVTAASASPRTTSPAHTTSPAQRPNGSNGVNHNDTPLPANPSCTNSPGTSGTCSSPQPFSTADHNNVGANTTSHANAYVSTRNGAAADNGSAAGTATGRPCAGCVGKADNKFPSGQSPNGPADHNNGYECDGNNGIGQTNPAHTGCQTSQVSPPPKCQTCAPAAQPCQCSSPPTHSTCSRPAPCQCVTAKSSATVSGSSEAKETVGGKASPEVKVPVSPGVSTRAVAPSATTGAVSSGATTSAPATTGVQATTGTTGSQTTGVQGSTGSASPPTVATGPSSPNVATGPSSAPPSTPGASGSAPAPSVLATSSSPSSGLAFTGFSALAAAAAALVLVGTGFLLVRIGRRRTA